ncbi:MAG TPA: hypothetical protein H9744_05095, partial [Candidatus Eisenbergiella stercoravium]|nr:hypothetical protein [Candidatus Eisenbergiella stercoravium]
PFLLSFGLCPFRLSTSGTVPLNNSFLEFSGLHYCLFVKVLSASYRSSAAFFPAFMPSQAFVLSSAATMIILSQVVS